MDICASMVPAVKSDTKEEAENGLATVEGLEIVQDSVCSTENETMNICALGMFIILEMTLNIWEYVDVKI